MKNTLNEDIKRIHEIMGLKVITEQSIPRPLIKSVLKNSDDEAYALRKLFNLADNEIDNILRQIDRVGVDNLSDDVLELLARQTIDNVDDIVKFMKVGKYLGSNFDEIAGTIIKRFESVNEIPYELRDGAVNLYRKKLDELPYLEGADEIKEKLVRDFQSQFDETFNDRIIRGATTSVNKELESLVDEILGTDILSDVPVDAVSQATRDMVAKNTAAYKEFIREAKKTKSYLRNISEEEYNKVMSDLLSSVKRIDPDTLAEIKRIHLGNPSWWSKKPWWAKVSFLIGAIGGGAPLAWLALRFLWERVTNMGDIQAVDRWFDEYILGKTMKLTQKNVKEHLIDKYPIDEPTFNDSYTIYLSEDLQTARVRGPRNFKITLVDGNISSVEN